MCDNNECEQCSIDTTGNRRHTCTGCGERCCHRCATPWGPQGRWTTCHECEWERQQRSREQNGDTGAWDDDNDNRR